MEKLMICDSRWGQFTPKVLAICWICPALFGSASSSNAIMVFPLDASAIRVRIDARGNALLHKEQSVEHDCLGKGDRKDRLHENLC
jgi:hypothetical protein